MTIFERLGPSTGMAFVVIHHVRGMPTLLPEILDAYTSMPVELAAADRILLPNHVYAVPSRQEMTLEDGFFLLRRRQKVRGGSSTFGVFLDSLSRTRHQGVAVVLSGQDENGTGALKTFKGTGGITIAQAPETAEEPEMPTAAIQTQCVDHVLAREAIASRLKMIAQNALRRSSPRSFRDRKSA